MLAVSLRTLLSLYLCSRCYNCVWKGRGNSQKTFNIWDPPFKTCFSLSKVTLALLLTGESSTVVESRCWSVP